MNLNKKYSLCTKCGDTRSDGLSDLCVHCICGHLLAPGGVFFEYQDETIKFHKDMDKTYIDKYRRVIDRIDSNKHYEESNVRIICLSCNGRESIKTRELIAGLCIKCNKNFTTKSRKRKYCSNECKWKTHEQKKA